MQISKNTTKYVQGHTLIITSTTLERKGLRKYITARYTHTYLYMVLLVCIYDMGGGRRRKGLCVMEH